MLANPFADGPPSYGQSYATPVVVNAVPVDASVVVVDGVPLDHI